MACFAVILISATASWIFFPHRPFLRWGVLYPIGWLLAVTAFAGVRGYFYGSVFDDRTGFEGAYLSVALWTLFVALPMSIITSLVAAIKRLPVSRHLLRAPPDR